MDSDWLPFHSAPRKPGWSLPVGAIDAHCHVFGPGAQFPYAPERKYTPCDASKHQLWRLRDHLGFARNVIVQATCHGADNAALVDALVSSEGKARGVATVRQSITDAALHELHDAGVRGVRFNFVKRLVDTRPTEAMQSIASRIESLGWHVVMYFEASDIEELTPIIAQCPVPVVIDHMARPDVSKSVNDPDFEAFLNLMSQNSHVWTKVSCPERLTQMSIDQIQKENYADVLPFSQTIVENFSDRVLWGTDWPHPNMKSHVPDDGQLVELIPQVARSADLQEKMLVENPEKLYWS
ncbi:MAG: amidohydrolase family protein [Gammaproteobacteria bacterium]|nr:amidohydrolase family protein [Gammaproteobacteria bacterium]